MSETHSFLHVKYWIKGLKYALFLEETWNKVLKAYLEVKKLNDIIEEKSGK